MKCSFVWRGQLYFFTGLNSQQSTVPVFQFGKIQFPSLLNFPILFRLEPHQFDINVSLYISLLSLYIFSLLCDALTFILCALAQLYKLATASILCLHYILNYFSFFAV